MTIGVIVPYWSLYLKFKGFSVTEIGQLMAVLLVTKVVSPNIWAAIADNVAVKKGSSLGLIKYAAFATLLIYSTTYWVDGFWYMALSMFGFCVFWNACLPQIEAATLNYLGGEKDKYGLIRLWGSIGFIVMVLGLGWVMDFAGAGAIMPAGALALLLMFGASTFMRDESQLTSLKDQVVIPISTLLNSKVLVLLLLCVLMQISHAPFYTFFSIYLESYGYSKLYIGSLWSIGVLFEVIIFVFGYKLLRKFSLSTLLSITFAAASIRWVVVAFFPEQKAAIVASQMMHAITYGLYHTVMIQLIDHLFQGRYQIRGQALYGSITYGLGGAIGSFASGFVWSMYGSNQLFFAAGLMMMFVFLCSLIVCPRITKGIMPLGSAQ